MTLPQARFRDGVALRSFQGRMIILFSSLLATAMVSQFFYKTSIDSMHRALLSAVGTAEVIHAAENFHSAAHSMLVLATSDHENDRVRARTEYFKQHGIAQKMLADLMVMTGEDGGSRHPPQSGRAMVKQMAAAFGRFSTVTDTLMATEKKSDEEDTARSLFDAIFDSYIELLHQYHDDRLESLKTDAHRINRWSTIMFVFQLGLVIFAGILVALFSVHALVRPYKRAQQFALSDGLTGLRNRRYLETFALPEMADMVRKGTAFSLSLMDIDKFKGINDTYGHQAGDELLIDMARIIASGVRESDSVIRYGGEEFLILLPGAGKEHSTPVVEKIRAAIEARPFRFSNRSESVHATASFGVASFPDDSDDVRILIELADERLYQAKNAGRNRVR
mgnify:CR=1 FL=1